MNIMRMVSEVHKMYPEMRIGQLIYCAAAKAGWNNDDVFYLPDEMLMRGLQEMMDRRKN